MKNNSSYMEKRDLSIYEFCEGVETILKNKLYGVILYGDISGKDIDICIVYYRDKNPNNTELKQLKAQIEKKYGIELDVLCFPSHIFSDALSRIANTTDIEKLEQQLIIIYEDRNFRYSVDTSIKFPINLPPIKTDEYKCINYRLEFSFDQEICKFL
jgi:predicted nucleotidyltransferase